MTNPVEDLVAISLWTDDLEENRKRDPEALLLHRTNVKISEEAGEVALALIGALGANPRKGYYATMDDVKKELLDVAITALGAWEHVDGHQGRSFDALHAQIAYVRERAGV